jgi:hypothetical protein
VPEGSKLSVVAGDTLVGARENDDTVFGLPCLPVLVTSKALCQDHHQFEIVDTADDRGLHLYHLIGRGTSACYLAQMGSFSSVCLPAEPAMT